LAKEERPVRALRFTGFLGIWTWPLVNIVLEVISRRGTSMRGTLSSVTTPKTTYSNIEEYSIWEDKSGVIRVRVHRKAERE